MDIVLLSLGMAFYVNYRLAKNPEKNHVEERFDSKHFESIQSLENPQFLVPPLDPLFGRDPNAANLTHF